MHTSRKKQEIELRFYEIPQGELVLPLIGTGWIREYGNDISGLHFHNLMEIGYCWEGEGEMILDDTSIPYSSGMLTVIPANYPHTTKSVLNTKSYWEYLFFDPRTILAESYPDNRIFAEKIEKLVNGNEQHYMEENGNLTMLTRMIIEECRHRKKYSGEYIRGLLLSLLIGIARHNNGETVWNENSNPQRRSGICYISGALEYISKRYMEDIKMATLAECCNLSETHFRRLFVEYMNMAPLEYINLIRIQQACELMKKVPCSMEELSERVGYTAVSSFNRNFKKIIGTTPYQYKKSSDNYQGRLLNVKVSAKKGW